MQGLLDIFLNCNVDYRADAQKQRQQLQQQELSTDAPDSSNVPASPVPVPDQRPTLKFGFSSKLGGPSKVGQS